MAIINRYLSGFVFLSSIVSSIAYAGRYRHHLSSRSHAPRGNAYGAGTWTSYEFPRGAWELDRIKL